MPSWYKWVLKTIRLTCFPQSSCTRGQRGMSPNWVTMFPMFFLGGNTNTSLYKWLHNARPVHMREAALVWTCVRKEWGFGWYTPRQADMHNHSHRKKHESANTDNCAQQQTSMDAHKIWTKVNQNCQTTMCTNNQTWNYGRSHHYEALLAEILWITGVLCCIIDHICWGWWWWGGWMVCCVWCGCVSTGTSDG